MKNLEKYIFQTSLLILFFVFTLLCLSAAGFFFVSGIKGFYVPAAFLLSAAALFYITKDVKSTIISSSSFLIIFLTFAAVLNQFYDLSYDGAGYHQDAIITLLKGYNPLSFVYVENIHPWANFFPRAMWYMESSFTKFTNQIESAKVFNVLFIISSFGLISKTLKSFSFKPLWAYLTAFLISFNFLSVYEAFTFMVDGVLLNVLFITICGYVLYLKEKKPLYLFVIGISNVLLINIKFTGILYYILLFISFAPFALHYKKIKQLSVCFILSSFFAFFIVGFSPYIVNLYKYKTPVYPVRITSNLQIDGYRQIDSKIDSNFKSRLAVFSKNAIFQPLDIKKMFEINYSNIPWGIFYPYLFIFSILMIFFLPDKKHRLIYLWFLSFILLSMFLNPAFMDLRRNVSGFLLCILPLCFASYNKRRLWASVIALLLILNNIPSSLFYIYKKNQSQIGINQIMNMAKYYGFADIWGTPLRKSVLYKFEQEGIRYEIKENKECSEFLKKQLLPSAKLYICIVPNKFKVKKARY